MLKKLARYYKDNGISQQRFTCPHREICGRGYPKFREGFVPLVGREYEKGDLPRLLFMSADPGYFAKDDPTTPEEGRKWMEAYVPTNRNGQWYRTQMLAFEILSHFGLDIESPEIGSPEISAYFAHTNSGKCCQNKPGRGQADAKLFENCRKYIRGELERLTPDILVTQGIPAYQAVEENFEVLRGDEQDIGRANDPNFKRFRPCEYRLIQLTPRRRTLWFPMFHPRNGSFHVQRKQALPHILKACKAFMAGKTVNLFGKKRRPKRQKPRA